jgi:hypothetical protein
VPGVAGAVTFAPPLGEAVGSLPLQAPEAVQDVAPLVAQLRMMVPPVGTLPGNAVKGTVKTGGCGVPPLTVTETDWAVLPPGPVQVST